MTTTTTRRLNSELRSLRTQWRRTAAGADLLNTGLPWCSHTAPDPTCEGCCIRLWCRDLAAPIADRAAAIKAELEKAA